MNPDELFDGFNAERQAAWETELVDRYGDAARTRIDQTNARMSTWQRADADAAMAGFERVEAALASLCSSGVPADDPVVQEVIASHYEVVCRFWTPDADSYAGLADMYVEHPEFRARYEARQPGLAEYLREGMRCFASTLHR